MGKKDSFPLQSCIETLGSRPMVAMWEYLFPTEEWPVGASLNWGADIKQLVGGENLERGELWVT